MAKFAHGADLWYCPDTRCNPQRVPFCRVAPRQKAGEQRCSRCKTAMATMPCRCALCQSPNPTPDERMRGLQAAREIGVILRRATYQNSKS